MVIYFVSKKLEKQLDPANVSRYYGGLARGVINRLSELANAKSLEEVPSNPPPKRHKLQRQDHCWAVSVNKNYRLIFQACGNFDPNDLTTITEICIYSIEDYH